MSVIVVLVRVAASISASTFFPGLGLGLDGLGFEAEAGYSGQNCTEKVLDCCRPSIFFFMLIHQQNGSRYMKKKEQENLTKLNYD